MPALYHGHIPTTSGVYRIVCTTTGKFYIGSAVNLRRRCAQHLYALRNNQHHTPHLQNAWKKYGPDAFLFEVLELVLPAFQVEREQYWLDKLKPFEKRGFNINRTANKPTFSPETCEKIRLAKLGKHHTPESRTKMGLANIGNAYQRGRMRTLQTRAQISATKHSRHTPELSQKLSVGHTQQMRTLIVTAPDGTEYAITGIKKFCREHGLDSPSLMRVVRGIYAHHKGWKARFPD